MSGLRETVTDVDLVHEAQAGDVHALGLLLVRHQADMRAVALSILGCGPDAEDALQDAIMIAMRRIGDLRDPAAVAPWLRAIVRNACRMQLRAATPIPVEDVETLTFPRGSPTQRNCCTVMPCGTGSGTPSMSFRPVCAW